MKTKPGTKVRITEDCRDEKTATGQIGVYEGDFPRGAAVRLGEGSEGYFYEEFVNGEIEFAAGPYKGEPLVERIPYWAPHSDIRHPVRDDLPISRTSEPEPPFWFETFNPRIRLPDDSVIWGDECWWAPAEDAPPLEEAQAGLKAHKEMLLELIMEAQKDRGAE